MVEGPIEYMIKILMVNHSRCSKHLSILNHAAGIACLLFERRYPGYLERGFILLKCVGFALLILFHFHRIFKTWGWEGTRANTLNHWIHLRSEDPEWFRRIWYFRIFIF